jgi:hypothetical protein
MYGVFLKDGARYAIRARKDAAIRIGNHRGEPFTVVTSSGLVVFDSEAGARKTARKKEKPVTNTKNETAAKKGHPTDILFTHGAKYFFRQMGAGAILIAENRGLSASLENGNTIAVTGGKAADRKAVTKEIDEFLTAQYSEFKVWKKTNRTSRKEWYGTPEGRKAMAGAENKFFEDYADRYLSGEVAAEEEDVI